MDERAARIGLNEALFREVNERVRGINEGFGQPLPEADFVCECGNDACTDRVRVELPEYERIRSDSRLFVIRHGHEIPEFEDVVEDHEAYVVVAKKPGDETRLAEATDPRR